MRSPVQRKVTTMKALQALVAAATIAVGLAAYGPPSQAHGPPPGGFYGGRVWSTGPRTHVIVGVGAPVWWGPRVWWGPVGWTGPWWPSVWVPPAPTVVVSPPAPVYIERPPAEPEAPPQQVWWYWCPQARAYYPYVKECPGGWQRVAPQSVMPADAAQ
jgi:hypothetical protein